ncbi:MAG: hypothetical protein ACQXXJ_07700 [Candidatus Bathyarchaeia archaeon]
MMNKHGTIVELEPPQPLRRPNPLNRFPYPNPLINITVATLSSRALSVKENWN